MISESDVYLLQEHAIATDDQHLRYLTYAALGHDVRIAMMPTTPGEKLRARQGCADQLQMMQLMGLKLKTIGTETIDALIIKVIGPGLPRDLPVHVIDQTGQPYGSTRRCCNNCGVMTVPDMHYLTSMKDWWSLPEDRRCSRE